MIRYFFIISILISFAGNISANDSTKTKPKRFLLDINGGMTSLFLNGPRQPHVVSGPNKSYDLRGGYSFQGNFMYQSRSSAILGYNFFCGIGYAANEMSFTENLNYSNNSTSKFQSFSYSPGSVKTSLLNQQISFSLGFRKTGPRINLSHKFGFLFSYVTDKNFIHIFTKQESGSYYDGVTWTSYTNDYTINDDFTFKESICPYYGFDIVFGNRMLQPHLGLDVIYFTNDIIAYSSESNLPVYAFNRAIMIRAYLGLTIGF